MVTDLVTVNGNRRLAGGVVEAKGSSKSFSREFPPSLTFVLKILYLGACRALTPES